MAHVSELIETDIEQYLKSHQYKSLLRFITCGSVDDGKSTLIGRLLYESKMIFEDQLAALEADSKKMGTQGEQIDFALLVDGLAAEREQGITIDVAYRFFSTDRRKFIVADTPGHEQYTRNMITGASTADLAVILIDARKGVLVQTRRHSYLVSLIGIKEVVLAVNKMDLVDYSQEKFDAIVAEYLEFAKQIGLTRITAIPMSAFKGDNITENSRQHALVHRLAADAASGDRADRGRKRGRAVSHAGAVGQPPEPGFPRLLRHRHRRPGAPVGDRLKTWPSGKESDGRVDRAGRRDRRGGVRPVGHDHAQGRDRHQPRRHSRQIRPAARRVGPVRIDHRVDERDPAAAGPSLSAQDRGAHRQRLGVDDQAQGQRQHPRAPGGEVAGAERDRGLQYQPRTEHRVRPL